MTKNIENSVYVGEFLILPYGLSDFRFATELCPFCGSGENNMKFNTLKNAKANAQQRTDRGEGLTYSKLCEDCVKNGVK